MNTNTWTVKAEEDTVSGDLVLPLPVDLLAQMGWHEGTELWWDVEDGKIVLKDKNNETSKTK